MNVEEEYTDILMNMESQVIALYEEDPNLVDYDVDKIYNHLFQYYKRSGEAKEEPPRNFTPIQTDLYHRVRFACEFSLGRVELETQDGLKLEQLIDPVEPEIVVACLRRLRKSVKNWTQQGGRQGYLDFVADFLETGGNYDDI